MLRLANMIVILTWSALHLSGQTAVASAASAASQARLASSFMGRRSAQKDRARVETFKRYVRGAGTHSDTVVNSCDTLGGTETGGPITCTAQIQVPQGAISLPIEVVEVAAVAIYQQTCGGGNPYCGDSLTLTISGPDGAALFNESLTTNGGPLPAVPNPPFVPDTPAQYLPIAGGCGFTWNCYNRVFGGSLGVGQYTTNGPALITVTQTYTGFGEYDTSGLVAYIPFSGNLIDPVPDLLTGNDILQDPESLAVLGTPVMGVAADGAARAVLRVPASNVGDPVVLTLFNDSAPPAQSSSPAADGVLGAIGGGATSSQIQVTAVSTNEGPMAFALYFPPTDFARNGNEADPTIYQRPVYVQTKDNQTGAQGELPVQILRPPVLLVHGLWGAPGDFDFLVGDLTQAPSPNIFCPAACLPLADYSYDTAISNPIPSSYPLNSFFSVAVSASIPGSALGFSYNAPVVLAEISEAIVDFRTENNAAAAQVDAVTHSMGGNMVRTLVTLPDYQDWSSFGIGTVHKLITIDTPHLGSPLATQLFQAQNACAAGYLALGQKWSLAGAVAGGSPVDGAVFDLETGSQALANQTGSGPGVDTEMIAATTNPLNLANVGTCSGNGSISNPVQFMNACAGALIYSRCQSSPLAQSLTPSGWQGVFGEQNDGAVGLSSQLNNSTGAFTVPGLIHSDGLVGLGFSGPSVLDSSSVANDIITLLNASVDSFNPLFKRHR